jgi:hypothetical protein
MRKSYSPELVSELEELFPDYTKAIELAKNNSLLLLNYIEGSFLTSIFPEKIFAALSLEELQKEARLIKRRQLFLIKLINEHKELRQCISNN